ncbi:MAG: hypothetical protein P4M00_15840 [Azospirillaceae bacterium]|nr:hypothetical protein [Azospirillaceae bacterium]
MRKVITSADVQDRDGGLLVPATTLERCPFLRTLFADSADAGPQFRDGLASIMPGLATEIVRRSNRAKEFVVLPERWITETTRCRFPRSGAPPPHHRHPTGTNADNAFR